MLKNMQKEKEATCIYCNSNNTKKIGKRKNKNQIIQRYFCKQCDKTFTLNTIKNKTYPIKIILNAISTYNLGHSQKEVSKIISQKHKTKVPQKTISNWLNQYNPITTFSKLRSKALKLNNPETNKPYTPKEIIQKQTLYHIQPYTFQYHKAKLELLFKNIKYNNQFTNSLKFYQPIKDYLNKITTDKFPHHIFKQKQSPDAVIAKKENKENNFQSSDAVIAKNNLFNDKNNQEQRASQLKFPHLKITHIKKQNLANKLTSLALNMANSNKDRHNAVQNFFLINDSTTIAAEIPVYLTKDDILYFISRGFQPHLVNQKTPITGHIDLLQIRNSLIHIMDYKPNANLNQTQSIQQLTIYALALASRTKLNLASFKCAWFDDKNYYEFFPLHVVYKLKKRRLPKEQNEVMTVKGTR